MSRTVGPERWDRKPPADILARRELARLAEARSGRTRVRPALITGKELTQFVELLIKDDMECIDPAGGYGYTDPVTYGGPPSGDWTTVKAWIGNTGRIDPIAGIPGSQYAIYLECLDAENWPVGKSPWAAETAYLEGDIVWPTDRYLKNYFMTCTSPGTSHTSEPSWNFTPEATTEDGLDVEWECSASIILAEYELVRRWTPDYFWMQEVLKASLVKDSMWRLRGDYCIGADVEMYLFWEKS